MAAMTLCQSVVSRCGCSFLACIRGSFYMAGEDKPNRLTMTGLPHESCSVVESPVTEPRLVTAAAMEASVEPTAYPTSAADKADRSLIPSPQNNTVCCSPCKLQDKVM